MSPLNQKLFQSLALTTVIFLTTGCMPKNADGSYNSAYSYHPYNQYHVNSQQERYTSYSSFQTPIPSNMAQKIEKDALALLGTDYKYGANGPYQYDCSSFTKHIFSKQGIKIPRVSKNQAKEGRYIRKHQLQKGDLIFFDSKKSSKISHVGIYLANGKFIHASSSEDKVAIGDLSSNYYTKHFKWGRRVIHENYAMR